MRGGIRCFWSFLGGICEDLGFWVDIEISEEQMMTVDEMES
jgi:hypothetical protein